MRVRTTVPLKHLAGINERTLPEDTDHAFQFRYIDIGAVGRGDLIAPPQDLSFEGAPSRARRLVRAGDTIVSTVRTYLRAVWHVSGDIDRLVVSTGFAVITPRTVDPRYLAWWIRSDPFIEEVVARSVGVSYPAINQEDLGGLPVRVPSLSEQRSIADFLDVESARIDALIRKKRKLRAAVLERSWSVVLRAVTLGLDDVDVGEAVSPWGILDPAWPVPHIGVIARIYPGTSFPVEEQGRESGDLPFVKVADLGRERATGLHQVSNWVSYDTARSLGARIAPAGAILYARVGAALLLNPRRILCEPAILDDNVRGIAFDRGDARYWAYLLSFLDLGALANSGPVPSISEDQVSAVPVPCPPLSEQCRIAGYCDQVMAHGRSIAIHLERQITLLQEHRQALVTAVVTGELDISGAAA